MKFVMENPEIDPDFLIISDDDAYIHLPHIWNLLYKQRALEKVGGVPSKIRFLYF